MRIIIFLLLFITSVAYSQSNSIRNSVFYKKKDNGNYDFYAENIDSYNKVVFIKFRKMENSNFNIGNIYSKTIRPGKNVLFTLQKLDKKKPINFAYKYELSKGCKEVAINTEIKYLLPVSSKKAFKVITHKFKSPKTGEKRQLNKNIVIIKMNDGDTIYASRSGLVNFHMMKLLMKGYKDGIKESVYISIMHKDCTFATYGNAKKTFVKEGDFVVAGMPIGLAKGSMILDLNYHEPIATYDKEMNKVRYKNNVISVPLNFDLPNGETKLDSTVLYQPIHSFETITQEMSKREIKKYKKSIGQ